MKKLSFLAVMVLALTLVSTFALAGRSLASDGKAEATVLKFNTMAGVQKPYTGNTNPIRGINGGGFSWVLSKAEGKLMANGELEVQVRGLVLGNDAPDAVRGTNPVPLFKAVVSCQTIDAGLAVTRNVSTKAFPATKTGNAEIEDTIELPSPCIAPIIFVVHGTAGVWFAATGT